MKSGTLISLTALVAAFTGVALSVPVHAQSRSMRPAAGTATLLRTSDLPPGYGNLRVATFATYTPKMTLKLGHGETTGCKTAAGITRSNWRDGEIEDSHTGTTKSGSVGEVSLCVWRLASIESAHASFLTEGPTLKTNPPSHLVKAPTVGEESVLVDGSEPGFAARALFFRHHDILLGLISTGFGGPGLSRSQLLSVGRTLNRRLG